MNNYDCYAPVGNNPFMNYLNAGDVENMKKEEACKVTRKEVENSFYKKSMFTGHQKKLDDNFMRKYYTMPVTQSTSSSSFANFLYPNTSLCRDSGYICKINSEKLKTTDRILLGTAEFKDSQHSLNYLNISEIYKN